MKIFVLIFMNSLLIADSKPNIATVDFVLESIPWMAVIYSDSTNSSFWCPGVIISSSAVLASAQCIIVDLHTFSLKVHVDGQTTGVRQIHFNHRNVIDPAGDDYAILAIEDLILVRKGGIVNYPNKFDTIYYDHCKMFNHHYNEESEVYVTNIMNFAFYRTHCKIDSGESTKLSASDKILCYGELDADQRRDVSWGSPIICPQFNYQYSNFENVIVGFTYRLQDGEKVCGLKIHNISCERKWIKKKLAELSWDNFIRA